MSERTERDDVIDEAIELLISEDTEGFMLTAVEADDVHLVGATDDVEQSLLAVYVLVEELRQMGEEEGVSIAPSDVIVAAGQVADERGLLGGEMTDMTR